MKRFFDILTLILSIYLLMTISMNVFSVDDPLQSQLTYYLVCLCFLGIFVWECLHADDKRRFWLNQWPLLLISIPFLLISDLLYPFHPQLAHALLFLPLIRAFFSIYLIVGLWVRNVYGKMLATYIIIDAFVVYYSSLSFYYFEIGKNPVVHDYADALWWAAMNFTTIGSNIISCTVIGKILGVVMGLGGMTLLPVFTAFVTGQIVKVRSHKVEDHK